MNQLSFIPSLAVAKPTGKTLKASGMKRASEHAEKTRNGWTGLALDYLYGYAQGRAKFSAEMVRAAAKGIVPDPPSLRAWGAVMLTAARRGWISKAGYVQVENPRAHECFASLWESKIYRG